MNKFPIFLYFTFTFLTLKAQDSTNITLPDVTVSAALQTTELKQTARQVAVITSQQIAQSPVQTLDGVLNYALGVDIRTRSPFGVQADVSIRGGHFEQTLILLDGIRLNDPQTGHHALNLPIPLSQIEKIEVLMGGASRVFGPAAFSGVINIITKKLDKTKLSTQMMWGQHGLKSAELYGVIKIVDAWKVSAGMQTLEHKGYTTNTQADRKSFVVTSQMAWRKHELTAQASKYENEFGASNFYHPKFYNQAEKVAAFVSSLRWSMQIAPQLLSTVTILRRTHWDRFDFDNYAATKPNSVNYHRSNVTDADWKLRWISSWGKTSFGLAHRTEKIISNRLGTPLEKPILIPETSVLYYNLGDERRHFSAFLEQSVSRNKWTFIGGTLLNHNAEFGTHWFPGLDISYKQSDKTTLYGSLNKSLRYPTFTELYLRTASVIGDASLQPESAWNAEVGVKKFTEIYQATAAIYYRKTNSAIDRVLFPNEPTPRMVAVDNINFGGMDASLKLALGKFWPKTEAWNKSFDINYAYAVADRREVGFQSFYTLNYLRHKVGVRWLVEPMSRLNVGLHYNFRYRAGTYQLDAKSPAIAYSPIHLMDVRTSYQLNNFQFLFDITNVFNRKYVDFGFVEQPRRWVSAGIKVVL